MKFNLSKPFEDESLWGWVTRLHLRTANRSPIQTMKAIFGRTFNAKQGIGSWPCEAFLCVCAEALGLTHSELESTVGLRPLLFHFRGKNDVLTRRRIRARTRRACPQCAQEEIERLGVPIWHRHHEIIGCVFCAKHKLRLVEWPVPHPARAWDLPGFGPYAFDQSSSVAPDVGEAFGLQMSTLVLAGFAGQLEAPTRLLADIRKDANRCGVTRGKLFSSSDLLKLTRGAFGAELWAYVDRASRFGETSETLQSLLRGEEQTDPVVWLALRSALATSPTAANKPSSSYQRTQLSKEMVDKVLPIASRSVNAAAQALSVSRSKLITAMNVHGLTVTYRQTGNRKFTEDQVSQMCSMLSSGTEQSEVAAQFGCGLEFIRELSIYSPELRATCFAAYSQLVERALPARSTMTVLQPELRSRIIEPGQFLGASG